MKTLDQVLEQVILQDKAIDIYMIPEALSEGYTLAQVKAYLDAWKASMRQQYLQKEQQTIKHLYNKGATNV
jgi:hypothetical protein